MLGGKKDGTGTMYRRARYYDPQTGRFTQEDPIGLAGGLNLYGYAAGDPANLSDPSGNLPIPAIMAGIGVVAGTVIGTGAYLLVTPRNQWSLGGGLTWAAGGALTGGALGLGAGLVAPGASVEVIQVLGLGRLIAGKGILGEATVIVAVTAAEREAAIAALQAAPKGTNLLLSQSFSTGRLAPGLTKEILQHYRTVARYAVQYKEVMDKSGIQVARLKLIEQWLRTLQ